MFSYTKVKGCRSLQFIDFEKKFKVQHFICPIVKNIAANENKEFTILPDNNHDNNWSDNMIKKYNVQGVQN